MIPSTELQASTAQKRAGIALALLAATAGALLLFLPILMLGYATYFLLDVVPAAGFTWGSELGQTFVLFGTLAVVSLLLLVIPLRLWRAAGRRIGTRQSVVLVGGLLAVWHAGLAVIWAWNSTLGFTHPALRDGPWYPIAFGIAAAVATVVTEKRAIPATVALVAVLGLVLSGSLRWHTAIPQGAQQVHVTVTASAVSLDPLTVHAGDIYVVLDTPRSSVNFTQDELAATQVPLSGSFDLAGCSDAQRAEDLGTQGTCGNVFKVTLPAGKYAFFVIGEPGPLPPTGRLEVLP